MNKDLLIKEEIDELILNINKLVITIPDNNVLILEKLLELSLSKIYNAGIEKMKDETYFDFKEQADINDLTNI